MNEKCQQFICSNYMFVPSIANGFLINTKKNSLCFETLARLLAAAEHHHESWSIANHIARIVVPPAQFVIEFIIRVRRLLALQVHFQVTVRTTRSKTENASSIVEIKILDKSCQDLNFIKNDNKLRSEAEKTHSPLVTPFGMISFKNSSLTRSRCCESCIP